TCRDRSANLLSLSSGPDQRRTFCVHAWHNPDAPARFLAQHAGRANLASHSGFRFGVYKGTRRFKRIMSNSGRSTPQRKLASQTVRFRSLPCTSLPPSRRVLSNRAAPHAPESGNRRVPRRENAHDSTHSSLPIARPFGFESPLSGNG